MKIWPAADFDDGIYVEVNLKILIMGLMVITAKYFCC